MKKISILIIALFCFHSRTFCQSNSNKLVIPTKDSVIYYEGIVAVDSTIKKRELYDRAEDWFLNNYQTGSEVDLEVDDVGDGNFKGVGRQSYVDVDGLKNHKFSFRFTLNLIVKDGKYKYQLYGFDGSDYISTMSDVKYKNIDFNKIYKEYMVGKSSEYNYKVLSLVLDKSVKQIISSLNKVMSVIDSDPDKF